MPLSPTESIKQWSVSTKPPPLLTCLRMAIQSLFLPLRGRVAAGGGAFVREPSAEPPRRWRCSAPGGHTSTPGKKTNSLSAGTLLFAISAGGKRTPPPPADLKTTFNFGDVWYAGNLCKLFNLVDHHLARDKWRLTGSLHAR